MRSASLGFWVDIIDERLGWHPKPKFYEDLGTAREATALHLGAATGRIRTIQAHVEMKASTSADSKLRSPESGERSSIGAERGNRIRARRTPRRPDRRYDRDHHQRAGDDGQTGRIVRRDAVEQR